MERYVLFVNSETDFLLLSVKNFLGGRYSTSTEVNLYFKGTPLSYQVPLTVTTDKGDEVLKTISGLFNSSTQHTIVFSDTDGRFDADNVSAVGAFTKIVTK